MNIDIKVYNYSTQSGRGSFIGILPTRSVFTVSGLEQSGITIELGHYERDSNTQFNYSFTVYNLSVQKNHHAVTPTG